MAEVEERPEWVEGREFRVDDLVRNTNGDAIASAGTPYMVKTNLSFVMRGYPDSPHRMNRETKEELLKHVCWTDEKIGRALKLLIKENPKGKLLRGLVRAEVGQIMPKKDTPDTFEGWMKWLVELKEVKTEKNKISTGALNITPVPVRTANVRIRGSERVWLRSTFHRADAYEGAVPVPLTVLGGAPEDVLDWIYEHTRDHLVPRSGDLVPEGGPEISDSDGLEIERHNIDEVINRLSEEGAFNERGVA